LLAPARRALAKGLWLGGDQPDYADWVLFGTLMWPHVGSDFFVLEKGPIVNWFHRCGELMAGGEEVRTLLAA